MKRLTTRLCDGRACFKPNLYGCKSSVICDRHAAIDDILGDDYDLDRLRELVEADREGRVPRYNIGTTVFDRFGKPWQVDVVELHSLYAENKWLYRCGHEGTDDYCALWEFEAFPSREAALKAREQDD